MNKLLCFSLVFLFSWVSQAENLCTKYEKNPEDIQLLKSLSSKLFYTYEELCTHKRILDIQKESRNYYYSDTDTIEEHAVMTLHYSEYSCEYHYNTERTQWINDRNYCYGTW